MPVVFVAFLYVWIFLTARYMFSASPMFVLSYVLFVENFVIVCGSLSLSGLLFPWIYIL